MTRQACKNLGLGPYDLMSPTEYDIRRYTREPSLRPLVHRRLVERAERNVDLVLQERERVKEVYREDDDSDVVRRGKADAAEKHMEFRQAELARIDRLRLKNKREAERLIYTLFVEVELQQEELDRIRREEEEKAKHEEHLREVRKEEQQRQLQREREIEEQEKLRKEEQERRAKIQQDRQAEFEARRALLEEQRHKAFERMENERREKNAKAAQMAKETEEKKQADYVAAVKKQESLDRELAERKRQRQQELEEENKRNEEKRQEQVRLVKHHRHRIIEEKRAKTESRIQKQQETFELLRQQREKELEELQEKERVRLAEAEKFRKTVNENRQRENEQLVEEEEQKLVEFYKRKAEEDDLRRERAVERAISIDDHYATAVRIAAMSEAKAIESTIIYDKRLRRIALLQQVRQKQAEEADLIRKSLEKEKNKVMAGTFTSKDIGKRNPKQLRELADQLGIDLAALKEKAKMTRRGRGSGMAKTLPPIEGANE
jgi:hypothetical protein